MDHADDDRLITANDVRARYGGISAMTLSRWLKDDRLNFPQPIRIHNLRYFRLADLVEWEKTRARRAA